MTKTVVEFLSSIRETLDLNPCILWDKNHYQFNFYLALHYKFHEDELLYVLLPTVSCLAKLFGKYLFSRTGNGFFWSDSGLSKCTKNTC